MKRHEALIRQPCSEDWGTMTGDDTRRFCGQCNKNVHNLSAMTETEARAVVGQKDVCVRYSVDPQTQSIRHRARRRFVVRAAATAVITAGLALPAAAAISREPGQVGLLSQAWEALTHWAAPELGAVQGGISIEHVPTEPPLPVAMGVVEAPIKVAVMGRIAVKPPPETKGDSL